MENLTQLPLPSGPSLGPRPLDPAAPPQPPDGEESRALAIGRRLLRLDADAPPALVASPPAGQVHRENVAPNESQNTPRQDATLGHLMTSRLATPTRPKQGPKIKCEEKWNKALVQEHRH